MMVWDTWVKNERQHSFLRIFFLMPAELPVAVVVIFVVASQSGEAAQADGVREEDLSSSIHPYLRMQQRQECFLCAEGKHYTFIHTQRIHPTTTQSSASNEFKQNHQLMKANVKQSQVCTLCSPCLVSRHKIHTRHDCAPRFLVKDLRKRHLTCVCRTLHQP